jgi:acetyl-CoA carboxylase carboxyltransferase component
VITGYGRVDGRLVAICAYDFTVMAGSMGTTGEIKVTRLRELALTKRMPFVWLLDSAGARIQEAVGSLFAGSGHLFREEVVASGVIPQVAALMGPCAAGTAYIPGLADFVPMVRGRGSMALAGPHLVRAAIGEDVTQEELGGSRVHCRKSGVGDLEVADDEECIARIREYLSYFPAHNGEPPPLGDTSDPIDRRDEALLDVLPESNRKPYDVEDVIRRIVDDGAYLSLKPQWAKTIVTCLARFGGRPVGIVANQPRQLGGILDNDAADKAARFVNLCNAFGLPLVFLQDVPGFMVGTKVEAAGIIRHGAKMLHAVANATVPKVTVVLRKAYGAGYYVMNGRAYEPDLIVAVAERRDQRHGRRGRGRDRHAPPGRGGRRPRGQEGRAGRRLPQDHRRLHRRAQRDDRRRHRPARDAAGDLPRAGDGAAQARGAPVEAQRRRAGVARPYICS